MSRRAKVQRTARRDSTPRPKASVGQTGGAVCAEAQSPNRWWPVAICVFLAVAVWIVFGQTVHHEFVNFDDDLNVYDNPVITQGLTINGIVWAFTRSHAANWHPLTSISHMVICQFSGLNPAAHHLTNVLLHAATVVLLFLVLRNLTGALWPSAFVAAVFAIHPLRAESVAWVTERKDVLSGLFFVLTIGAYARYARRPFAIGRYLLVVALYALGLLSKPMLVTVPFVLLLLDYWPLQRWRSAKSQASGGVSTPSNPTVGTSASVLLIEKIPLLLFAAASCVATVWAAKHSLEPTQALSFPWRVGNALASYAAYLGQMFYPVGLAVLYPHPRNLLPVGTVLFSTIVLLIVSALAAAGWRKRPYLLVGWLWYLGMLVPVIGLMQVGNQAHADRFTYLPQIGLYLMLAWTAVDLCGAWQKCRVVLGGVAAMILTSLMILAHAQTKHWHDSVSLWSHTLACAPENVIAHNNFGNALADKKRLDEATQHYQRAIQLKPEDAEAYMNLGNRLAEQGKFPEAMEQYQLALERKPNDAKAHYNLGLTLSLQGRVDEAVPHYERAVQLDADYVEAHNNLGNALVRQGRLTEAVSQYERVLELKPGFAQARYNLGNTLARLERFDEAVQQYERAIQLKPDYLEAHNNLGIALAKQSKLREALQHFQQAMNLATAKGESEIAEDIRRRMESYQRAAPQSEAQ